MKYSPLSLELRFFRLHIRTIDIFGGWSSFRNWSFDCHVCRQRTQWARRTHTASPQSKTENTGARNPDPSPSGYPLVDTSVSTPRHSHASMQMNGYGRTYICQMLSVADAAKKTCATFELNALKGHTHWCEWPKCVARLLEGATYTGVFYGNR